MTANEVCAVIESETGRPVTAETRVEDIQADSLEFLNLLLVLGEQAGKEIPNAHIDRLHTVADIAAELV
jgi:acyl carrier protein